MGETMVLWFHGRMAYLTKPSMKPSDLFRGFMVRPTPSLGHQMTISCAEQLTAGGGGSPPPPHI